MSRTTLCFLYLLISLSVAAQNKVDKEGALVRSDTLHKSIKLCFTGHEYDEGFDYVLRILKKHKVAGSFFLTGDFVRSHTHLVKTIAVQGHFVGAHSDKHLLYCDWTHRDSLLHTTEKIKSDILQNLLVLKRLGIHPKYFMPPYEWHNKKVVAIASGLHQTTINFSPGTRSNADYTTPDMPNYTSSKAILKSIYDYEALKGMHGFHLLIHPGTSPKRKDKFYYQLDGLITTLKEKGYEFTKF